MKSGVPIVSVAALEAMPTKALLARLQRLQRCEESARLSDASSDELKAATGILFKDTPEWRAAYDELKKLLATREHVPSGADAKAVRMDRAAANRTRERRRR